MNSKDTKPIDRRTAVLRLGGIAALSTSLGVIPIRAAKSQTPASQIPEDFFIELGDVANRTELGMINVAVSERPDSTNVEVEIKNIIRDPLLRAEKYGYNLVPLWKHDQISLGKTMLRNQISSTTLPPEKEIPSPLNIKVEDTDNCWEVFLSIFLATFGIDSKLKNNIAKFLDERGLRSLVQDILKASKKQDWPRATMLLRKFFIILTSPGIINALEETIGSKAFAKILKTFANKLVPYLGWALMAASFITSIWINWNRLVKCKI